MLKFEDYFQEKKNNAEPAVEPTVKPAKPDVNPQEKPNKPSVDPFKRRPNIKPGEEPKPKAVILTEKYEFDFEDWDDTDISGMGMELAIDGLIEDTINDINRVIDSEAVGTGVDVLEVKKQAAKAIKQLWIEKINNTFKF